eukprot:PhF_6_TR19920/c1_g1_i1/m.28969
MNWISSTNQGMCTKYLRFRCRCSHGWIGRCGLPRYDRTTHLAGSSTSYTNWYIILLLMEGTTTPKGSGRYFQPRPRKCYNFSSRRKINTTTTLKSNWIFGITTLPHPR